MSSHALTNQGLLSAAGTTVEAVGRYVTLDALRVFAAVGIIWLHVGEAGAASALQPLIALGRFAVPFFACASVFLVFQGVLAGHKRSFPSYLISRVMRLYVPFLIFSAIYLGAKFGKAVVIADAPTPDWWSLFWPPFGHLWFLPFILAISVLAYPLARVCAAHPAMRGVLAIVAACAGLLIAATPRPMAVDACGNFFWHSYDALPCALWGILIGLAVHRRGVHPLGPRWLTIVTGTVAALVGTIALISLSRHNLWENMAGFGVMLLALSLPAGYIFTWLARFGPTAFGVYLVHMIFVQTLFEVLALRGFHGLVAVDLAVFLISTVLSIAFVMLAKRWRTTRWIVP